MDRCSMGRYFEGRVPSLIILSMTFNTIVMTSNFVGHKPLYFFGLIVSSGSVIFPLTYLVTAIVTEVYGRQVASLIILMGLICSLFASFYISQSIHFPYPGFWTNQEAFAEIMGQAKNIFMLSSVAYILSEYTNLYVFTRLSQIYKGNKFVFRVLCATFLAVIIDTLALLPIILKSSSSGQIVLRKTLSLIGFKFAFICLFTTFIPFIRQFLIKNKNESVIAVQADSYEDLSLPEAESKSNVIWINSRN